MTDFVSLFTGMSERDIGYLLKGLVQRSINEELTNSELSNVDNKTPVMITNSKDVELMNDIGIQTAINIEAPTTYLMPEEPDGKDLKIWLKFQNAGELRDWSYQKNKGFAVGANTMPGLFYRTESRNMLKSELYSYFNGASHYGYVRDGPPVQIKPNITANKITAFFMRLKPISLAKLLYAENNSWFTKTDDDQLRYGYSVTIDIKGNINFYIKNDYRQYHLFVKDAYNDLITNPIVQINPTSYRFENFNPINFSTNYETLCGVVAQHPPFDDWFFKYDPSNHTMAVLKTTENNDSVVFASTGVITEPAYLSCPIQEGKWTDSGTVQTTIYDNSGNNNNGTITNIPTGGQWNDDNTLSSSGLDSNNIQIDFGSISAINTLTEFTISFWFNPLDELITPATSRYILHKGLAVSNSFLIYRGASSNDIRVNIYNTGSGDVKTAIFPNAFPNANDWYFIVVKWKTGEAVKISVDNSSFVNSSTTLSMTITNSTNNLSLFRTSNSAKGKIALFRFYTTQISQTTQDDLYYQGYHNPLFPKSENIQPEPSEDPDPIFIPFSNVYTLDKMSTPVLDDYRRINSLGGDSVLIPRYDVADGTSVSNPETLIYDIDDGVSTGGGVVPFNAEYTLTIPGGNNSAVRLTDSENNDAAAIEVSSGSSLIGKKITKATFYLKGISSPTGNLYCRIWNSSGSVVATLGYNGTAGAGLNSASVDTSNHTAYSFWDTTSAYGNMAVGWKVGIEYNTGSGSDEIDVRRDSDAPKSNEIQASRDKDDGDWNTNSSFDVCGILYSGGTGSATTDPFIYMEYTQKISGGSTNSYRYDRIAEKFGSGDTAVLTKIPTKVKFKVKKVGSPTGTLRCYLITSVNGTILTEFSNSINVSTIPTTTTEYTFTNLSNTSAVGTNYVIMLFWEGMGSSTTAKIGVLTNDGTSDNHNGTSSHIQKYGYIPGFTSFSDTLSYTATDLSGKIYTGGNDFNAYIRLSSTRTRVATKAVNSSSSIHNRKITKVVARIKKVGAPGGVITCRIRDPTDTQKVLYSSVDVSTITADSSYHDVEFTNFVHTYLINASTGSGDKIVYEFSGSDNSNYIEFNANHDVFDTSTLSTITQTYDSGSYVDDAQHDLAGKMYEGGEPDLGSRTRVAQSIEHQDSRLKGKKITRVNQYMIRTGTASGTVSCNIRRGTDDSLVKTIGTYSVSSLSTTVSAPTLVPFEDTTNNYPMTVGDKVTIEFTGGDTSNQVGVLVRNVTPNYDGSFSYIRKYDENDYDDSEPTMDLCAVMDEGGFFYTPDPGSIPDPTPVNDKDLIICAGNNKVSGFFECFFMEFRIYTKDITTDQADNLYANRYSISPISPNAILMPFSLKMNTADPV